LGFHVDGFGAAFLGALVVSVVSTLLSIFVRDLHRRVAALLCAVERDDTGRHLARAVDAIRNQLRIERRRPSRRCCRR
jgi:hypothetical protein